MNAPDIRTVEVMRKHFRGILEEYSIAEVNGINRERERIRKILSDYERDLLSNALDGVGLSYQMSTINFLKNKIEES